MQVVIGRRLVLLNSSSGRRWYDVPLTAAEALACHPHLTLQLGPAISPILNPRLDGLEVYARPRSEVAAQGEDGSLDHLGLCLSLMNPPCSATAMLVCPGNLAASGAAAALHCICALSLQLAPAALPAAMPHKRAPIFASFSTNRADWIPFIWFPFLVPHSWCQRGSRAGHGGRQASCRWRPRSCSGRLVAEPLYRQAPTATMCRDAAAHGPVPPGGQRASQVRPCPPARPPATLTIFPSISAQQSQQRQHYLSLVWVSTCPSAAALPGQKACVP